MGQTLILYVNRREGRTVLVGPWDAGATWALCARLRDLPTCRTAEVLASDVTLLFSGLSFQRCVDTLAEQARATPP